VDLGIAGKRAAVAAASGGLGYASAEVLVAEGAQVTICGSDPERARAAAEKLGAQYLVADLRDPEAAAGFVGQASDRMGGLDILVVNGPGPRPGTVAETVLGDYQDALNRSLLSVVGMCLAAAPGMQAQGWGRIVAITSIGVRQPLPNLVLSNTARTGATGFLRTLAREIARDGVTVNSLQPASHLTNRLRSMFDSEEELARAGDDIPAGRHGTPEEFGAIVGFLCSMQAGYVTGAAIPVDGGAYQALL
jgi:3-oxoacyl-[acyl-carrier protein] reductase